MIIDEAQDLAQRILKTGKVLKKEVIVGHKPDEYFSAKSYMHCFYIVKLCEQIFWITQINNIFTSIYDLKAEKELTTL